MKYLEIKNLGKIWAKNTEHEVIAIDNISLSFEKGDFVSIVGSNASGKSTLLNIISGNIVSTKGNIFLDGENITHTPEHEKSFKISKVKQDPNHSLVSGLSVEENFALALKRGLPKRIRPLITKNVRDFCKNCLKGLNLGIENRLASDVSVFSGGQRQALALICATLNNPALLLLDEHTAALDPKTSEKVLELTNEIVQKEKITTLMVTHNVTNALKYGNRLLVMENGRIKYNINACDKNKLSVADVVEMIENSNYK